METIILVLITLATFTLTNRMLCWYGDCIDRAITRKREAGRYTRHYTTHNDAWSHVNKRDIR